MTFCECLRFVHCMILSAYQFGMGLGSNDELNDGVN